MAKVTKRVTFCFISMVLTIQWCSLAVAEDEENKKKKRDSRPTAAEGTQRPEGGPPAMMDQMFGRLDSDGDGQISQEEFLAPVLERFQRADRNGDGSIDRQEMMAAREQMAAMMRGGPLGMPGNRPFERPEGRPGDAAPGERGPAEDRIRQLMQRVQLDDQGRLELEDVPEPMRERLAQLDANADGFIDSSEGGQLLTRLQNARKPGETKSKGGREKGSSENGRRGAQSQGPQKPKRPAEENRADENSVEEKSVEENRD